MEPVPSSPAVEVRMRLRFPSLYPLALLAIAGLFVVSPVIPSLAAQGPARLFNGHDLSGWQQAGPGSFVVKDGMMKTEGGMGMLWYTREKIGNATIRVVFKMTGK